MTHVRYKHHHGTDDPGVVVAKVGTWESRLTVTGESLAVTGCAPAAWQQAPHAFDGHGRAELHDEEALVVACRVCRRYFVVLPHQRANAETNARRDRHAARIKDDVASFADLAAVERFLDESGFATSTASYAPDDLDALRVNARAATLGGRVNEHSVDDGSQDRTLPIRR